MSAAHLLWLSTGSTLRPMTLAPRAANWSSRAATAPSSVVQTGVKSLGWEKRTAQLSPIHSWKWMVPWVVSAEKSGARSLMRSDMSSASFGSSNRSETKNPPQQFSAGGPVRLVNLTLLQDYTPMSPQGQQQHRHIQVGAILIIIFREAEWFTLLTIDNRT